MSDNLPNGFIGFSSHKPGFESAADAMRKNARAVQLGEAPSFPRNHDSESKVAPNSMSNRPAAPVRPAMSDRLGTGFDQDGLDGGEPIPFDMDKVDAIS